MDWFSKVKKKVSRYEWTANDFQTSEKISNLYNNFVLHRTEKTPQDFIKDNTSDRKTTQSKQTSYSRNVNL